MFVECGGYVLNTEDIKYVTPVRYHKSVAPPNGNIIEEADYYFNVHFLSSPQNLRLGYTEIEQAIKDKNKLTDYLIGKGD